MPNEQIQAEPLHQIQEHVNGARAGEQPVVRAAARPEGQGAFLQQRLLSLDVYRGLIMVLLAFTGFGLAATATNHLRDEGDRLAGGPKTFDILGFSVDNPQWKQGESPFWRAVHYQFEHVEWAGCGLWDLIQPSFMFMVGAAMAFSYAKRRQQGQSYARMLGHAAVRSVVLIVLGIFLISSNQSSTNWSLMNVLTQIGLGYTFLFLLWDRPLPVQAVAAAVILVGTWLLYVLYPDAGVNVQTGVPNVGVSAAWAQEHLSGMGAAWHKNANVGHAVDLWLLNLLPQTFTHNRHGYQTLNFLPSLATMLFGLMAGELLRSRRSARQKFQILLGAGLAGLAVGLVLDLTGVCPMVKKIWTPGWAIFSTGWCCVILAGLYGLIDVRGWRAWTWPLVVVGVNSIAIYCMGMLLRGWTAGTFRTHFGPEVFQVFGPLWEPTVRDVTVGLVFWLVCWWMYRQRIFLRI